MTTCISSPAVIGCATVLHFDGTGLRIYAERLERRRFASLGRSDREDPITLTVSELDLFLDGNAMVGRVTLAPPPLTYSSLAPDRTR